MTTSSSGNIHLDKAEEALREGLNSEDDGPVQIRATLALAHEQRTSNLIAALNSKQQLQDQSEIAVWMDIARRLSLQNDGTLTIPAPSLPTKAVGSKDSAYLHSAARNLHDGYAVGGSGVTAMVIALLINTAEAMEAEGK